MYNDLYDVVLTLRHVRLRSMIKNALYRDEQIINMEVAEYRSACSLSLPRRLQQKISLRGNCKDKLYMLSLLDLDDIYRKATQKSGPIDYKPEGLNDFMLTNLIKGENDGTVAGKIGRVLFAAVFKDDSDSWNPIRKINGNSARVLMCSEDMIVVEPVRRTLTVVRNDAEWGKDLSSSIELLQSDVRTPIIRLAAELLLCAITGANTDTFLFLKNKCSEIQISYDHAEFKEVSLRVCMKKPMMMQYLLYCNSP